MADFTVEQRAILSQLAKGYLPALEQMAKKLTAPYWWYWGAGPERGRTIEGGTMCFVNTGTRLIGVTAEHVHTACVAALNGDARVACQIGGHSFEPEKRILDLSKELDLAVYDVSEVQANAARADIHHAPVWPPVVAEQDVHIIGGWLWTLSEHGPGTTTNQFLHFVARLSGSSDRHLGIGTTTSTSIPWGRNALAPGTNLGGMSGGPVFRLQERGLSVLTLVGVIYEYGPLLEMALARPLSLIGPDGRIVGP